MNILIISAMFPPIKTGTSFYSKNIAQTLYNQKNNVIVVTVKNKEADNDNYSFPVYRLKAWHINVKNYFKHLRFCSIYISNYKNLFEIAIKNKIDVVLLVNHYLDIAFPAIIVSRKIKKPLYISVGTQLQSLNPIKNWILRWLDRLICGRLIFPFCKNIISWDSEIERYINEVQSKKIAKKSVIIPFGVNGDINQFNNYFHNYSKLNQIIGVGAIISQRDYLFQLKVFKELIENFPELTFKIIGHIYMKKPMRLAYKLGIKEKVIFAGELPHEQVIEEMKNSTLHWMMLSGNYLGLGTATIEAMLLGIPSLSNVPANLLGKNSLLNMENYVYTDGKNILETKNKIRQLLNNQSLRQNIGLTGRTFVKENLDWNFIGNEMIKLFKKNRYN